MSYEASEEGFVIKVSSLYSGYIKGNIGVSIWMLGGKGSWIPGSRFEGLAFIDKCLPSGFMGLGPGV